MSHTELDRLEGDVCDARRRMKSDLEVLRALETFSDRVERLIADIKERAAANPVAVGAIAAGLAWRILRRQRPC
jgi:hypothetical protein